VVLSNIFEFRQRRRQIFDCLPSIAKIPVDTAQSIAMSPLSFAELFTMRRRYDSSHGIIRRRGIDASISPIVAAAIRRMPRFFRESSSENSWGSIRDSMPTFSLSSSSSSLSLSGKGQSRRNNVNNVDHVTACIYSSRLIARVWRHADRQLG